MRKLLLLAVPVLVLGSFGVAQASHDKTARVWDAITGKLLATLAGHAGVVRSAQFSPDGTRIVTASHDRTARVWNTVTGRHVTTLS